MSLYVYINYRCAVKLSMFENYIQILQQKGTKYFYNSPIQCDLSGLFLRLHRGNLPYCNFFNGDADMNCSKITDQKHTEA